MIDWHSRFLQQAGWTKPLRDYLFHQVGIDRLSRVLEVGCGTGAILQSLPSFLPLFGLDLDRNRLEEAHLHACRASLVCGDAHSLPFAAGSFDVTFCHFLLLWVKNPLLVLQEMKRLTRQGGAVLALAEPDYSHRVDLPDALILPGRLQAESLSRQGADVSLGARLADLFQEAGIQVKESGILQGTGLTPPDLSEWEKEWDVLEADLQGFLQPRELAEYKALDRKARLDGSRVLFVPTYFAFGLV